MMAARVAGVPMPLPFICRAISSSVDSRPAVSIAESRDASLCCAGGFVWSLLTSAARTVRVSPGDSGGRAVSSSASADFFFARPAFGGFASGGTSRQPFCSTTRPFVRNWCSPTPVMTFVASYSHAG